MNINEEYFFLQDAGDSPTVYLKGFDDNMIFKGNKFIEQPESPYDLYMTDPVPRGHKFCDLYMCGKYQVVVPKIKEAIEKLSPAKVDFIPADLYDKKNNSEEFFILNCYNLQNVLDLESSEYRLSANGGILSIEKLVLDSEKIKNIPEKERLIITIEESRTYRIFHQSVIDEIEKTNPKGCYAISIDAWKDDLMFLV